MMGAREMEASWKEGERWAGIVRPYRAADVVRLRGSVHVEHSLARIGAERLWSLLRSDVPVTALGALTGNQAIQQVQAGLPAIYLSGWQVAADANDAGQMYPDQSLYPADSVPNAVRRVNNALKREDEKQTMDSGGDAYWFAPIVADGEAGFGGPLNAFELMNAMIESGAAGVHFEDQLASAKKCGHLGGKVLVSTRVFIQKLIAARLAADICDVPTILIARTDANSAKLLTTDVDTRDRPFVLDEERTAEGSTAVPGEPRSRSPAGSRTRPMPTCCGARRRARTSTRLERSRRRSALDSQGRCSHTTAPLPSIGDGSWIVRQSVVSSTSSRTWGTASSSSPSPASTR